MTKQELIEQYKSENPTLRRGSQETGYEEITGAEYDAIIESWANAHLEKLAKLEGDEQAKAQAESKLTALGLTLDDLKALGL